MQRISAVSPHTCFRLLGSCLLWSSLSCGDTSPTDPEQQTARTEDAAAESAEPATAPGSAGNTSGTGGRADAGARSDGGNKPPSVPATPTAASDASASGAVDGGSAGSAVSDAGGASTGAPGAACDRACLTELNTKYLESVIAHDASKLPTAPGVRFTENGKELPLTGGLWGVAKALRSFRQDFAEVPAGQTAGFVALDDDAGAVLLAFRLKVVDRRVTEIETTTCRQGQATFFSPNSLSKREPIYDMEVEPAQRLPRAKLIEIVDLYFQALESGDASKVPFDSTASRNENGTVTASGSRLSNVSMFSYIEEIDRRYALVDEERGNVLPWVLFQIPMGIGGGSRTLHLAELFKVAGGKIMNIHAIMVNQPLGTPSGWD